MDFKQIEAFVNVVKYKSFSKAADAMFFSQPTISAHIAALEKELDVKLLNRRGRSVEMTEDGKKFYKHAVEMVNIREQAVHEMKADKEEYRTLEIQTSSIPALIFLPEILSRFSKENRDVRFYVESSDTQTVINNIAERLGDIGFVGGIREGDGLHFDKIFEDKMVLVVPADYDLPDEISIQDVIAYPFIWREYGSATRQFFENEAARLGISAASFHAVANFNDLDPLIRSVEQGLGISILSDMTVRRFASDRIRIVRIKDMELIRSFYMVTADDAVLSPAAEAFRRFVLENSIRSSSPAASAHRKS